MKKVLNMANIKDYKIGNAKLNIKHGTGALAVFNVAKKLQERGIPTNVPDTVQR